MRMWKKVLDDEALAIAEIDTEEQVADTDNE